jgi:hypothetical protein
METTACCDRGNDWIVGGTGKDHAFGGWDDDLIIWTMTRSRRAVSTTSPTPPRPTRTSPMAARAVMF